MVEVGTDAGDQLPRAERLAHVVVGTQFQPLHPLIFAATAGEHDHHRPALVAELREQVEGVGGAQRHRQHQQVGVLGLKQRQGARSIACREHRKAGPLQGQREHRQELPVIVDEEDGHARSALPPLPAASRGTGALPRTPTPMPP
jgi:hypothetical protein